MRKKREPTGIMVNVLSSLCLKLDGSEEGYAKCEMTLGMVQSKAGKTYLLSNKGVGTAKSLEEGDYLEVALYRVKEPDDYSTSLYPEWSIRINQAALGEFLDDRDIKIVGQKDLAIFIRFENLLVGGSRILTFGKPPKTNFYLWKKKLEKE